MSLIYVAPFGGGTVFLSFLERGYRSQRVGDWSRAAAYFAAARAQHDTPEERWSLAVARERIAERILSLQGPAGCFRRSRIRPDSSQLDWRRGARRAGGLRRR